MSVGVYVNGLVSTSETDCCFSSSVAEALSMACVLVVVLTVVALISPSGAVKTAALTLSARLGATGTGSVGATKAASRRGWVLGAPVASVGAVVPLVRRRW